jgi:hypothetical protein
MNFNNITTNYSKLFSNSKFNKVIIFPACFFLLLLLLDVFFRASARLRAR